MNTKTKILVIFFSIITFGIYPLIALRKKHNGPNNELSSSNKIVVNVEKLLELLKGYDNIVGVEHTHSKLKIFVKSHEGVNLDEIQKLKGVSGVFVTADSVTIIVGLSAKALAQKLIS